MKIAFVIKYLENASGGAERVLRDVSAGLCDLGHEVTILSFDRQQAESFFLLDTRVQWIKLDKARDQQRLDRGFSHLLRSLGPMLTLRRELKRLKPQAAVGFMVTAFLPLSLFGMGLGIGLYGSEHNTYANYRSSLKRVAFRLAVARLQKTSVLSKSVAQTFPASVQKRMIIIANPVMIAERRAQSVGKQEGTKICLNVGSLSKQKDQVTLIKAFGLLQNDCPDWHLRIVGEGPLRATLENLIRELDLQIRVTLVGQVSNIAEEYVNAQLFVTTSIYEGFGLVTAEAIAHGLPAIGFADCHGTNEIIQDRINGTLVNIQPGSTREQALAAEIRALMQDSVKRQQLIAPPSEAREKNESALRAWLELLPAT